MSLEVDLRTHLEQFHTAPFLFVGSGLSRRYLGTEDWEGLLRRFAAMTGRPYEYFRASANGVYPEVASEIARELHPIWWSSANFEASRAKYPHDSKNRESALKIEISRYLEQVGETRLTDPLLAQELEVLPRVTIDGIITTNWDLLLEQLFPEFPKYVGQDELLFSPTHGVGEIYKIHGCCSKPNSLIATSGDYLRFRERNSYLAAKLLTVFAEHPIVFLGYSLIDTNITDILQSIAVCLTTENIDKLRDRLVLVRWDPQAETYRWEDSVVVASGFSIPVKTVTTNSLLSVYECLASLPRKFPARILRRLKEHVYELVHDNDPADRLYVVDIDDDNVDLAKVKVVYGVGLSVEGRKVRLSSDPDAEPVRVTNDPTAPAIPYRIELDASTYSSLQEELEAFVRAWRSDPLAYIARSRLDAFYAERLKLASSEDGFSCLLISAMHQQGTPIHYWALKIGRRRLVPLLKHEIELDLFPRIRRAARLAFAIGMSEGRDMLELIVKKSKHVAVRTLASRLLKRLDQSPTIHAEYRSPVRSTHSIEGTDVTLDVATLFDHPEQVELVLSFLTGQSDHKSRTRLKQLDAYFYGTKL
jgi:hypothetical protein